MTDLKSLIDNSSPLNEIIRTQYKYTHPKASVYILAFFIQRYDDVNDPNDKGKGIAEWSLYHDDNERPLLELTNTPIEDFNNMINSAGWEDKGYETVPSK